MLRLKKFPKLIHYCDINEKNAQERKCTCDHDNDPAQKVKKSSIFSTLGKFYFRERVNKCLHTK